MGWSAMMENLQVLRMSIGRKNQMQGEKVGENMDLKRSFAEVVKKTMCRAISPVQVKIERKEIQNNLERLKHCVVGRWNPSFGDEEDLEKVGRFLASSWGLKGSLGLAKLEDSKVLLEFELLEEAKRASLSGEKRMGAIRLGFEEWRPWDGCREEKEDSEEIWVRIFGLPVLLWNPTVLRRVGEECGGFIDIDSKTKKLEELQWARILVRSAGGDKPSTLEIGIEEEVFTLALWWESRPTVRKIRVDSRRWGEVRDDSKARADSRVEMEPVGERNEALVPSEEGTGRQAVEGVGCVVNEGTLIKPKARVERSTGLLSPEQRMGWQEDNLGWLSNGDQAQETRARTIVKGSGGPNVERGPILIERRPSSIGSDFNQAKRWAQVGSGPEAVLEREEARSSWEKGIPSATDKALAEEAMSGGVFRSFWVLEESNDVGPGMDDKGCWDMVEFNKDPNLVRGVEWNTERTESQEIRKRREKIHSKELMEKSKFERELKRLECSVNYEKGANDGGVARSLGSGRFLDWRGVGCGWQAAGGLLICWDKRSMEVVDWEEGQYSLSCRFKNVEDGAVWVFTGVYGPFTKEAREGLWEELGLAGRPPLARGVFTWSGRPEQPVLGKLDRFLVTPSWLDNFSGVIQRRLPRPVSDHFPILLEGGGLRRGPSPFRFENMWLKVEGFLDLIRSWWREIEVRGTASYRLAAKTKELNRS
ncbi:hypothetical protein CK203_047573 [Vitis vinifera]|uniref:DUF4283 domain-containing protein n=1 Tax=Vitis vinifera TaxID=29760 RepID=A0A438GWX9_VITVI|nr:hypothetical protein CK203_047573 [Vitis vinifera]